MTYSHLLRVIICTPRVHFVSSSAFGFGGYELHPRGVNIIPKVDAAKGFTYFQPRVHCNVHSFKVRVFGWNRKLGSEQNVFIMEFQYILSVFTHEKPKTRTEENERGSSKLSSLER